LTEMAPVVTGTKPVPETDTLLLVVKTAPEAETALDPEKVPALDGQNWIVALVALLPDSEKLAPEVILKGGFGPAETVPVAGDVPAMCCMLTVAAVQLPTWTLPKLREEGPTLSCGWM
jgi:hypothetical protein